MRTRLAMPRCIGLDLDNTVIDYAPAYCAVAREIGLPQHLVDRESIRGSLRKSDEDDEEWQRFQALLYTDGLAFARPAPGLLEFLRLCDSMGVNVVIISHKTEATPARFGARDLRGPASEWLSTQGITPAHVSPDAVSFCTNRVEKVRAIAELQCDVFVDDLMEILTDAKFPVSASAWWFCASDVGSISGTTGHLSGDFYALTAWLTVPDTGDSPDLHVR